MDIFTIVNNNLITFVTSKITEMNERIRQFLIAENKTSAQLAEEIGVQPSGISHILSGRNHPSLDFVLKVLEKYPFLSTDWLLFGRGSMYKEDKMQTLFDVEVAEPTENESLKRESMVHNPEDGQDNVKNSNLLGKFSSKVNSGAVEVERIVWFYNDNSFEEYYPSRS